MENVRLVDSFFFFFYHGEFLYAFVLPVFFLCFVLLTCYTHLSSVTVLLLSYFLPSHTLSLLIYRCGLPSTPCSCSRCMYAALHVKLHDGG